MPEVNVERVEVIHVKLTPKEATLLAGLVQNSHPDEAPEVVQFKEELFNSLRNSKQRN